MKKILYLTIAIFALTMYAAPASAAISFNASSSAAAGASSNTTVTSSITIAAGSQIGVVENIGAYSSAAGNTISASFNGSPVTLIASATRANSTDVYDYMYDVVGMPAGTYVASATVTSASKVLTMSLNAFNGVNQCTPIGAATTTSQTTNPAESASITTTAVNSWILDGATYGYTTSTTSTFTNGASQIQRTNPGSTQAGNAFGSSGVTSDKPGTTITSYTMTQTANFTANLPASVMIVAELEADTGCIVFVPPTADFTMRNAVSTFYGLTIR
jgi:hypothetical protein